MKKKLSSLQICAIAYFIILCNNLGITNDIYSQIGDLILNLRQLHRKLLSVVFFKIAKK